MDAHCLAIRPLKDSWIFFQFLAIMSKAAVNIHVQVCMNLSFHFSGMNPHEFSNSVVQ